MSKAWYQTLHREPQALLLPGQVPMWTCLICTKQYKLYAKSNQKAHIYAKHVAHANLPFKCTCCDMKFPTNAACRQHEECVHVWHVRHRPHSRPDPPVTDQILARKMLEDLDRRVAICERADYASIDEGVLPPPPPPRPRATKGKPVEKVDPITGDVVGHFSSMLEASHKTGVSNVAISMACNGRKELAGGFRWRLAPLRRWIKRVRKKKRDEHRCDPHPAPAHPIPPQPTPSRPSPPPPTPAHP